MEGYTPFSVNDISNISFLFRGALSLGVTLDKQMGK